MSASAPSAVSGGTNGAILSGVGGDAGEVGTGAALVPPGAAGWGEVVPAAGPSVADGSAAVAAIGPFGDASANSRTNWRRLSAQSSPEPASSVWEPVRPSTPTGFSMTAAATPAEEDMPSTVAGPEPATPSFASRGTDASRQSHKPSLRPQTGQHRRPHFSNVAAQKCLLYTIGRVTRGLTKQPSLRRLAKRLSPCHRHNRETPRPFERRAMGLVPGATVRFPAAHGVVR